VRNVAIFVDKNGRTVIQQHLLRSIQGEIRLTPREAMVVSLTLAADMGPNAFVNDTSKGESEPLFKSADELAQAIVELDAFQRMVGGKPEPTAAMEKIKQARKRFEQECEKYLEAERQ
jgi:hypothetical protein